MKKKNRIAIGGIIIILVAFLLYFMLFGRVTPKAYAVDTYCYTQSQAQASADAEIKFRGYCTKGCYALNTLDTSDPLYYKGGECLTDRPYVAICDDRFSSGSCSTDNLVNECSEDDIGNQGSCSFGNVCVRKPEGRRCIPSTNYVCLTAMKYSNEERRCIRIGCQSDSSCSETESCLLASSGIEFVCKPTGMYYIFENGKCILKDVSILPSSTIYYSELGRCQESNGLQVTLDTTTIKFSSIQVPKKVAINTQFIITGFFLPSKSGTYVVSADIDLKSFAPFSLVIEGKPSTGCSKTPYSSGGQQYISAGQPTAFKLTLNSPEKAGQYTFAIRSGLNCDQSIALESFILEVGERGATELSGGSEIKEGGECVVDYKSTCLDDKQIVVFKCINNKYEATDELCEEEFIVDPSRKKEVKCSKFQTLKDNSCKFDIEKFFSDKIVITSFITGFILVIVIIFIVFLPKKRRK